MSRKNSLKRSKSFAPNTIMNGTPTSNSNTTITPLSTTTFKQNLRKKRKISTISENTAGEHDSSLHIFTNNNSNFDSPKKKVNSNLLDVSKAGIALVMGMGDLGQLGLGPDYPERSKPTKISKCEMLSEGNKVVEIFAGGVHSLCVTHAGDVYSFGCNDEYALGRETNGDEELEMRPHCISIGKQLDCKVKVVLATAGDSHTAFLSDKGQLFLCGTFRDSSGSIGLVEPMTMEMLPRQVLPDLFITKIASGTDHVAALTHMGDLYTMGSSEQGQLGRVSRHLSHRGGRHGVSLLLTPQSCRVPHGVKFIDVWCGSSSTLALAGAHGERYPQQIYACGLNNYGQLGLLGADDGETCQYMLSKVFRFNHLMPIKSFALGAHHTLILTARGSVYAIGRRAYGRLGMTGVKESIENDKLSSQIQFISVPQRSFRRTAQPSLNGHTELETATDIERISFDKFILEDAVLIPVRIGGLLQDKNVTSISCGSTCSFAIDDNGTAYAWGMGSNKQLGNGSEDDLLEPTVITGAQLEGKVVTMISSGGQHTMLIACVKESKTD